MKTFLNKTILFLVVVFVLVNIVQILPPYYWGNPGFISKFEFVNESDEDYDSFFFGSSRTYNHISPVVFDESVDVQIKSFNLGSAATFVPEAYFLLENFIKDSDKENNKYLFVELQSVIYISDQNIQTNRAKYYLWPKEYFFAVRSIYNNKHKSTQVNFDGIKNYTKLFLEKLTGWGVLHEVVGYFLDTDEPYWFGLESQGFVALKPTNQGLINRNNEFLENTSTLTYRKNQTNQIYRDGPSADLNPIHLARINELISLAEKKGYHLILLVPPRLPPVHYHELLPIIDQLPDDVVLDMADPEKYPQFYTVENSFDVGHFDENGTTLFTREVAEEFNRIITSQ